MPVTILRQTPAWIDTPSGELAEEIWRTPASDSAKPPIDSGAIRGDAEHISGFSESDGARHKCTFIRDARQDVQTPQNAGRRVIYV